LRKSPEAALAGSFCRFYFPVTGNGGSVFLQNSKRTAHSWAGFPLGCAQHSLATERGTAVVLTAIHIDTRPMLKEQLWTASFAVEFGEGTGTEDVSVQLRVERYFGDGRTGDRSKISSKESTSVAISSMATDAVNATGIPGDESMPKPPPEE